MARTQIEMQSAQANIASAKYLERIAEALERIAEALEQSVGITYDEPPKQEAPWSPNEM